MTIEAAATVDPDGVTPAAVRDLAARLITPELVVLPVRHHSPACAWQVRSLFERTPPSAVLVEGPPAFDRLLPLLADDGTRMPVAVFTYAVQTGADGNEQRTGAYYPFCDYSPELVAIRLAHAAGVPVRFADLDHPEQVAASATPPPGPDAPGSLLDERGYDHSVYLQALADRTGCRDGEELWEHLVESGADGRDLRAHVEVLAAYCLLARAGHTADELAADGTAAREAEMTHHVREALDARRPGDGPVLAVLGGFHAVVLPDLLAAPPPRPQRRARVSEQEASLIRYGFDRLDRLNGYASGMTSPAWHQLVWDGMVRRAKAGLAPSARGRHEAALEMLLAVADRLRREQRQELPVPSVQAAYEAALRLAALRGREGPVRDDVLDAVTSAYVKGDADGAGRVVLAVARETLAGRTLGRVPPGAGVPPLVRDVRERCRRQRLKVEDADPHRVVLDIHRSAAHRTTSRLLHGLALLGVPLGRRTAGPDFVTGVGVDRLQEHWDYAWSIGVEAALVEAAVHGATLPAAVARRFGLLVEGRLEDGDVRDARAAAGLLVQACVLGLHDRLADVAQVLRACVAAERDFAAAASAASTLALLRQAREPLEAWHVPDLDGLLAAAYTRALLLGRDLPMLDAKDETVLRACVDGLVGLRELLVGADAVEGLDPDPYWLLVDELTAGHAAPLVAGAATGLAYSAGRLAGERVAALVGGHLGGLVAPAVAVTFLRGLLLTAREAAWQEGGLLAVLDGLLREATEESFVETLPELRLAFADLTPRETDRVAEQVSRLHGVDVAVAVRYDLDDDLLGVHLALTRDVVAGLDADGLADWVAS